jgi:hypothetical protein
MLGVLPDFIADCFAASSAVIQMYAGKLHSLPSHHRKRSGLPRMLAGHQPMLGGGPLCHVVISVLLWLWHDVHGGAICKASELLKVWNIRRDVFCLRGLP